MQSVKHEKLIVYESDRTIYETSMEAIAVSSESAKSNSSSTLSKTTPNKPSTSSAPAKTQTTSKTIAGIEQDIRRIALAQVGKPYFYGGAGPDSYDCSSLIYYILKTAADVTLPRTQE